RRRPEFIVLGRWVAFTARQCAELDPFEAELLAMRHLGDRVLDTGDGHDTHAEQPVGSDGAIFLGEPVIVAADDRLIDLVMADVPPEPRPRTYCREQDFGVEPIFVLLFDTLLGRASAGSVGDFEAEGLPRSLGTTGAQVEKIRFQ